MIVEITAAGEEDTLALGRLLGQLVRPGDVIGLRGTLGAGKTALVRGLAEGLGVDPERVRSPSFALMVTYEGGRLPLHHLDLYRIEPIEDDRLALREVLYGTGVSAIEWVERFGEELEQLVVEIEMTKAGAVPPSDARRIRLRAGGSRYEPLVEAVRSRWP